MSVDLRDLELISYELASDINYLSGKSLFLTGGTGFFGKWILEAIRHLNNFHNLNFKVVVLTRDAERFRSQSPHLFDHHLFEYREGDVRGFGFFDAAFDFCIHAATEASVVLNAQQPELMRQTIMNGAVRVAEFARLTGVKRLLYTSSGAAYGPQPVGLDRMPESFSDNPLFNSSDAYATAKRDSELYLIQQGNFDVVIARCFAFSGPYLPLNGGFAFGNFIRDAIAGNGINIRGNGTAIRSYLYAADLVIWLMRMLVRGRSGDTYNVGSQDAISVRDLAVKISEIAEIGGPIILGVQNERESVYVPDTSKAIYELNLKNYTTLDDAISRSVNFWKNPF